MSAEALQVAKVYRHLLRAVKKHVAKEDRAAKHLTQKIKLAHNYTFLPSSVHEQQHLTLYNGYAGPIISLHRSYEMKKVLGKSAASVGLQPYQP
ncbi:hypothetical protein PRUPE_2G218400 [Prunus persica]|uniref:Uncharacterized protein n=1 Tax=Prunus persica TaxID=3760 RepID=A0A251QJJ6_PRUPE|nr:hypothetical protein PRUPE_2G218400 [Prunus persica]